MHERRALHSPGKRDGVPRAVDIGLQGGLQGRVECDPAGAVEDKVDVGSYLRGPFFRIAEVVARDVAAEHDDLFVQEIAETGPVAVAKRRKGRRVLHDFVETHAALRLAGRPHHEVDAPNLREELEQHPETHLAQESRSAEQEDAPPGKGFAHMNAGPHDFGRHGRFSRTPRGS